MKDQLLFKRYQQGLENGELLSPYCEKCRTFSFHSSVFCSSCGSKDLIIKKSKTTGVIQTFTVIRVAAEGMKTPFIVAMVRTDSNIHVMGNLEGIDPETASMELIGKPVKLAGKKTAPDRFSPFVQQSLVFTLVE